MAEVTLRIGGRAHLVACRDGEEPQLEALGRLLDSHAPAAARAAGAAGERTMLFIALMLADKLLEAEREPGGGASAAALDRIAVALEELADTLEKDVGLEKTIGLEKDVESA